MPLFENDNDKLQAFMEQLNLAVQSTRKIDDSVTSRSNGSRTTPYGNSKVAKAETQFNDETKQIDKKNVQAILAEGLKIQSNQDATTANIKLQDNADVGDNSIAIDTFDISVDAYGNDKITKQGLSETVVLE